MANDQQGPGYQAPNFDLMQESPPPQRQRSLAIGRGIGNALGIVGASLADTLNPVKGAPHPASEMVTQTWQQMGADIYSDLQTRWFKEEEKQFDEMYVKPFQQAAQGLNKRMRQTMSNAAMGIFVDPTSGNVMKIDPRGDQAIRIKEDAIQQALSENTELSKQLFEDASKKFGGNPYVNNRIQNMIMSQTKMISDRFKPTQHMQGEHSMAQIENLRAQAFNARASGRRQNKEDKPAWGDMTFAEIAAEKGGVPQALRFLLSSPTGNAYLESSGYMADAKNTIAEEIREQYLASTGQDISATQPEKFNQLVNAQNDRMRRKAMGDLIKDQDPQLARRLSADPQYENMFIDIPHQDVKRNIVQIEQNRIEQEVRRKAQEFGDVERAVKWAEENWIESQVDSYRGRYHDPRFFHELRLALAKQLERIRHGAAGDMGGVSGLFSTSGRNSGLGTQNDVRSRRRNRRKGRGNR